MSAARENLVGVPGVAFLLFFDETSGAEDLLRGEVLGAVEGDDIVTIAQDVFLFPRNERSRPKEG